MNKKVRDTISEFHNDELELLGVTMTLTDTQAKSTLEMPGTGYVRMSQNRQGKFAFIAGESTPPVSYKELFRETTPGKAVPMDRWKLELIDPDGTKWQVKRLEPPSSHHAQERPTIYFGRVHELVLELPISYVEDYQLIQISFHGRFDFPVYLDSCPANATLSKTVKSANATKVQYFTLDNTDCSLSEEGGVCYFRMQARKDYPIQVAAEKILTAMAFVFSFHALTASLYLDSGRDSRLILRTLVEPASTAKPRHLPLPPDTAFGAQPLYLMLDSLFTYLMRSSENADAEFETALWSVASARSENLTSRALALSMGVECILGKVKRDLPENDDLRREVKAMLDMAVDLLHQDTLSRVSGMLANAHRPTVRDALNYLLVHKAVEKKQIDAWGKLRNAVVHGGLPQAWTFQEIVDRLDASETLFNRIVFHRIGYDGLYKDRSTRGWPLASLSNRATLPVDDAP